MARSKLVELFNRIIKVQDRKDKIYVNGSDNLYPERVERVINNSVTAKLSVKKFIQFISGLGFDDDINDTVFNKKKNLTFLNLLKRAANDVGYQYGFYLHINYDVEGIPNYLDILKFKNCRVSEEDDYGYKGYVWYSKDWGKEQSVFWVRDKKSKNWYYPYNPDINVINEQRKNDAPKNATPEQLIKSYRGQVLFVNLEEDTVYPNSLIDAAYNDADTEHRISIFRNDRPKNGFVGATIAVIPEVADDKEWKARQEEFKGLLGAENASNFLLLEAKKDSDKPLADYIHIETIESNISTKQFEYDEKMIQENILNSFNNLPKVLIKGSDGALFGASGELLETSMKIYQRNTQNERKVLEDTFNMIFKDHPDYRERFNIIPIVKDEESNDLEPETAEDGEPLGQ